MAFTVAPIAVWPRWRLALILWICLSSCTHALDMTYCSSENDAGNNFITSIYMSNGKCQDNCGGYAFAVISNQDCWCSNYIPADQVSNSECNTDCPGFPSEQCAGSGLYAYFALSGGTPSGTAGGSSSASRTSSSSAKTSSSSLSSSTQTTTRATTSTAPSVLTSVVTQSAGVSTILVTQTPAQATDSALGASSQTSKGSSGLSGGAVAGIVVGVAIAIGLVIGAAVFVWLRRRHQRHLVAASEGGSFTTSSRAGKSNGGIPSRQVSQMSSAGLLSRPSRVNTGGFSAAEGNNGAATVNSDRNSTHMTVDQRLNPWAIYSNEESRVSNVSLQDNQDYSRQLRVANPDP